MKDPQRFRWLMLVIVGQMLYSAGASVTSGSFLIYYVKLWTSSAVMIGWFLILPELVHVGALATDYLIRRFGSVKRVWLVTAVVARGLALILASIGFLDPHAANQAMIPMLFGVLAIAEMIRAISYTAFIAWVSELFGRERIGRLFGYREFGVVLVTMAFPPIAAWLRVRLLQSSAEHDATAYSIVFIVADLLVFAGLAVIAFLPDVSRRSQDVHTAAKAQESFFGGVRRLIQDRSYRRVLITSLHLAAAQGLTQSVFFKYQVDVLGIELTVATLLNTLMYAVQLPLAVATGKWLDRDDNRKIYALGIFVVACAMPFWFLLSDNLYWLVTIYFFWGAFAIVNVAGRSVVLRLVQRDDVPTAITAFRFGAGLMAAATGLLGGYWLDLALTGTAVIAALGPYLTIILVSMIGRFTAPLWLLGWKDERTSLRAPLNQLEVPPRDVEHIHVAGQE